MNDDMRITGVACSDCRAPVDSSDPCSNCGSVVRTFSVTLCVSAPTIVRQRATLAASIKEHRANFKAWYADVLEVLHACGTNTGITAFMITLPLLERYLRLKSGMTPKDDVGEKFRANLTATFPALNIDQVAGDFWNVFRHGFLHQATLSLEKKGGKDLPAGRLTHAVPDAVRIESDGTFTVNPVSFSRTVVSAIEQDFEMFVGKDSGAPPLPKVFDYSLPDGQPVIVSTSSRP